MTKKSRHKEMLAAYEDTLNDFRTAYYSLSWYQFKKRREYRKEINKYEQLCLMTWVLVTFDKADEKIYTEMDKIEDDFDAGYPT